MTESTNPKRSNKAKDIEKRLAGVEVVPPRQRTEVSQLPRWVKTALIMRAVDGLTYKEAAARFQKTGSTLSGYGKSPAAKKWLSSLAEFLEDPVAMAQAYLRGNAMSVTLERVAFLEAAVNAGDYKEGDRIAKDLQDRMGIAPKKAEQSGAITLNLNIGGGALEVPMIESSYEVVEAEIEDE